MGKETKKIVVRYGTREDSIYTFPVSNLEKLYWKYEEIKEKLNNGSGAIPNKERLGNICQTIETLLEIKKSNSEMDIEIDMKFLSETVGVTKPIIQSYLFQICHQRKRQNHLADDAYPES